MAVAKECFFGSKSRQNISEMIVRALFGKRRVICDHFLDNKGENIQKQALFSFAVNNYRVIMHSVLFFSFVPFSNFRISFGTIRSS